MIETEYTPQKSILISLRNIPRDDLLDVYFSLKSVLTEYDYALSIRKHAGGGSGT